LSFLPLYGHGFKRRSSRLAEGCGLAVPEFEVACGMTNINVRMSWNSV
jgi:hypothetical protein